MEEGVPTATYSAGEGQAAGARIDAEDGDRVGPLVTGVEIAAGGVELKLRG